MNKLLIFLVVLPAITIGQTKNELINKLSFGDFTPGYRLIISYDQSRVPMVEQDTRHGRVVPIYFWYPSSGTPQSNMNFKSYLDDLAFSLGEEVEKNDILDKAKEFFANYHFDIPDTIISNYMNLDIQTIAGRDLPIAEGKFPVVVFSHGHVDRWWIWGEFLASYGIAVIGTPNAGTFEKRHDMGVSGLETQIRDAQFAVSIVTRDENIDKESIIAIGSSYGSLTAAGYATRDSRVKGVISLDGIFADINEGELLTKTPYFDYQRFDTPVLHVNSGFHWSSNYTIMDRLIHADQYRIEMKKMRHSDYHFEGMADLFSCNFRGGELVDNSTGFASLTKYVLAFIQGITGNPDQLDLLKSKLEDVDNTEFIQGSKPSYSAGEMLNVIESEGFDKAVKIYESAKKTQPQPFSAQTFYEVGLTLHRYRMINEEIIWFEFYKDSYPKSADAHYRLARLTALSGNPELGKELLKKVIEIIPNDPHISEDRKKYLIDRANYFMNR